MAAGKGPTVTLTFAGDAKNLRAKVAQVIRDTDVLDKKLSGVGKAGVIGFAGLAGSVLSVGTAAGVAALGIAALPLAIAGAGALIISKNEEIKKSFEEVGQTLNQTLSEATKPLEGTFRNLADQVKTFAEQNKQPLTDMFAAAAPHIQILTDALLGLAEDLIPRFTSLMEQTTPVTEALGYAIDVIGNAFGQALEIFAGESDNAALGLRAVADAIAWAIVKAAEFIAWLTSWIPVIQENWSLISGIGGVLLTFGTTVWTVVKAVNGIKTAWMALSLVFSASPLGVVVTLVLGLVAALIYLWNTNEGFRAAVTAAWEWIKSTAVTVWTAITDAIRAAVDWIKQKIDEISQVPGKVREWFNNMKDWAIAKAVELVNWLKGLPGRILSAIGSLANLLWNAGRDLLTGLWNGISAAAGWLKTKVRNFFASLLPGWAKDFLGIRSPSKVFAEIGQEVPLGFALGMDRNLGVVAEAAGRMATVAVAGASSGLHAAMAEIRDRLAAGKLVYEDLSWRGMSANAARYNDEISRMFQAAGGGDRNQLLRWLTSQTATPPSAQAQVTFSGNTSDALASTIMQMIRTGQIQIRVA